MSDDPRLDMAWRTGRKVGRTVYAQLGPEPSDDDPLIGCMDTPEIAADAVDAHNQLLDRFLGWVGGVADKLAADL